MATVFISHVEEDQALALEIASGLERAGHTTWYYERDSSPGLSYLLQVNGAIEACQVVVLVISPRALDSAQVTAEVVRAHETGKSFIPVRTGISHEDFRRRKPDWSMAIGAAASIAVPETGVASVLPEILAGLELLSAERARRGDWPLPPVSAAAPAGTARRRTWQWVAVGASALAVLLALYGSDRGKQTPVAGLETSVDIAGSGDASRASAAKPDASVARTTTPAARERLSCTESSARSRVRERGRLEARDDVSDVLYAFVICEERDNANDTIEMHIKGSSTVGTRWTDESAAAKAADMDRRGVECESTGTPAVRSTGSHDPRSIEFVLCQESGQPTSIAVHATTRKADASAYPEKVLRVAWPR